MTTIASVPIFDYTDGSQLYQLSAKALLTVPVWEGNRTMDVAHVDELDSSITDPRGLQGPYSVVTYASELGFPEANRVIDGQHRQEVLRRYFIREPDAEDFPVLVRRYQIADHSAAVTIFQQINHAKPMVYRGSPTERLHDIVTALRRAFIFERKDGSAVAVIRQGCNRPCLNTDHLEAALKTRRILDRPELTPAIIVAHAEKMNAAYALDNTLLPAGHTRSMLTRACEYSFFLGLDPKCGWLAGL